MEELRRATIAFRGTPTAARRATIVSLVDQLDVTRAEDVIRAFTCYFQLVNLAEERQRLRVLARRARSGKPVKDSIDALDVDASAFEDLRITPVLTAHPTEAKRRAVVEHLWRIGTLLEQLEDLPTGAADEQEIHRRLREEIAGLWRTEPIRRHRPEPLDEVRATLALFDQTIFVTLPAIYRAVDRTLDPERCGARPPSFAPFLRWGTWVGGDRDGNPAVTAEVTRAAMAIQTDHALRGMEAAARRIARTLSVSERDVPPSRALRRALDRDAGELPEVATELGRTLSDAPHRRKLGLAAHRLAATRLGTRGAYAGPSEFLTDIETLQRSLEAGGAPRLAWGELQHLRWQVETFGFHLASMEVRQHSSVLATARAEVAEARVVPALAADAGGLGDLPGDRGHPAATGTPGVRTRRGELHEVGGRPGRGAGARASRGARGASRRRARAVARVAARPRERHHDPGRVDRDAGDQGAPSPPRQRARGDGGLLRLREGGRACSPPTSSCTRRSARWRRGRASTGCGSRSSTAEAAPWAAAADRRARRSRAEPPGSMDGRFKVTEQGEVAFARYGNPALARRHLEQLTNAVVRASAGGPTDAPIPPTGSPRRSP